MTRPSRWDLLGQIAAEAEMPAGGSDPQAGFAFAVEWVTSTGERIRGVGQGPARNASRWFVGTVTHDCRVIALELTYRSGVLERIAMDLHPQAGDELAHQVVIA